VWHPVRYGGFAQGKIEGYVGPAELGAANNLERVIVADCTRFIGAPA
jgi:hypothetical protein